MESVLYDFTRQDASGAVCTTRAWAKVPERLSPAARETAMAQRREGHDRGRAALRMPARRTYRYGRRRRPFAER